ncbi:MAG: CoA pyrophosphatase [Chloroflexi bacterium]|nr:MAG: CoA pyrophosphatase [Chloroflexota bacterium]
MKEMITLKDVQNALQLSGFDVEAAHGLMMPQMRPSVRGPNRLGKARVGGVLLLLYCLNHELHLVLTRRREDLNAHAGQISFPGGRQEPDEPLSVTALRETQEEVGIPETAVSIIGQLTQIYIPPSDFEVHPYVGWYENGRPQFSPGTNEVAEIIEVSLSHLLNPNTRREEPWDFRGQQITVPFFDVEGHKVWGATAIMLSEFIERIRVNQL